MSENPYHFEPDRDLPAVNRFDDLEAGHFEDYPYPPTPFTIVLKPAVLGNDAEIIVVEKDFLRLTCKKLKNPVDIQRGNPDVKMNVAPRLVIFELPGQKPLMLKVAYSRRQRFELALLDCWYKKIQDPVQARADVKKTLVSWAFMVPTGIVIAMFLPVAFCTLPLFFHSIWFYTRELYILLPFYILGGIILFCVLKLQVWTLYVLFGGWSVFGAFFFYIIFRETGLGAIGFLPLFAIFPAIYFHAILRVRRIPKYFIESDV